MDGTNGLVLGENCCVEVVCEFAPALSTRGPLNGGVSVAVGGEDDAGPVVEVKDVPRKPKQAVITDFFQRTTSRNSLGQTIPDSVG